MGSCSNIKEVPQVGNSQVLPGKVLQPTHPPNEKEIDVNPLLGFISANQGDENKLEFISKRISASSSNDVVKQPEIRISEQPTLTISK